MIQNQYEILLKYEFKESKRYLLKRTKFNHLL